MFCILESLYSNLGSPKGNMLNLMYMAVADQLTIMDLLPSQNPRNADVAIPHGGAHVISCDSKILSWKKKDP